MTRILILLSLGAVINAAFLPSYLDYSRGLESLFGTKREAAQKKKERSLCDTKECELIANVIKESMDESVDPCNDFYEYACGRWSNINPRPENKTTWSLWEMVEEKVQKQVEGIIRDDAKPTDLFAVKLAKLWYKSCMDEEAAERRGVEPLLSTMWRFGGWPLIMEDGEWDDSIYTWQLVDDHYARLMAANTFHDLHYGRFYYEANDTIVLDIPHLLLNLHLLLPDSSRYSSSDDSDENNESGEGSQEKGSKEKRPKKGEDDEADEEEENNEEDNEEVMVRKKVHRKLGRSRSSGNSEGLTKMRTKRDILKEKVLRSMRTQRKHATHGVHHNAKKTKEASDKKKQGRRKSDKRLGRSKKNNKRTKITEENDLDEKMKKSKSTPTKTRVHNTKQHGQRHHVGQRTRASKRAEKDESPNTDDVENEDSSDNEVPTEDNDEEQDNGSANEDDNEDNEEDEEEDSDAEDDEEDEDDEDDPEEEERKRLQRVEKYKDYVFNVSLLLSKERGVEVSHERIKKGIEDMVDFAIKLGELALMEPIEPGETTIDEFQELYDSLPSRTSNSKVNWRKKVEKLLEEAGITLDGDVELLLLPNYFKKLVELLDETSGETIVNYIHWNFVSGIGILTTKEMEELYRNCYGKWKYESREELCVRQVEMSNVVAYQFVEKHFSKEIAQTARDMIDDIQKEVEYQIKEATWMDEDTEHFILDKLVNMKNLVGYPEWYKNTTLVKRYFQGLTVGPSYYENVLSYLKYRKFKEMRSSLDEEMELDVDPLELNAFFMPEENSIAITAADFQNPFFALNRPWNVNYGIIGVVMGHEVNHGFDDSGHLYDRKGKPMEWLSAMAAAYDKRAMCFVDQYNKYPLVKGKNVTFEDYGNRTAGENIADTMGLQAVFRAYQRRERECARPDPALPGLEKFSNEQTFFLSFANVWCESGDVDPEYAIMQAKYDVHSTGRIRVLGSVSNSDDFAKAFNCPVGSPMNPEKKCNIWI